METAGSGEQGSRWIQVTPLLERPKLDDGKKKAIELAKQDDLGYSSPRAAIRQEGWNSMVGKFCAVVVTQTFEKTVPYHKEDGFY